MNREPFSYLISNPHDLSAPDVAYLETVVQQYPFCGLGYSLLAKGHANTGNETAPATLRKAAAYALSRNALRKLLSGEFPAQRTSYTSVADLLDGRVPDLAYQRKYAKDTPQEVADKVDAAEQPLRGFGLDYSDVLFNEGAKKGPQGVEETEKPGKVVARLQQEQLNIIDRFIAAEPRIGPLRRASPGNVEEEPEDLLQKRQPAPSGGLVTESFAQILVRQGKLEQAIGVYEKLSLKKPEKSAYFAQKIDELKGQLL